MQTSTVPKTKGRRGPAPAPSARRDVASGDSGQECTDQGYARILVPLDGSALAHRALGPAADLAARAGATLVLLRAALPAEVPGIGRRLALELGETDARAALRDASREAAHSGVPPERIEQVVALPAAGARPDPVAAIGQAVELSGADLVVMSTRGRTGLGRALFGSVAEAVVRRSPVPVLLLRPYVEALPTAIPDGPGGGEPPVGPSVLVCLDGSPAAEATLEHAVRLARTLGVGIVLLRVVPEPDLLFGQGLGAGPAARAAGEYLAAVAESLVEEAPALPFVHTDVPRATPEGVAAAIAARAAEWNARAVALATHGRAGAARLLLGSVTTAVVATARRPVLVVRP